MEKMCDCFVQFSDEDFRGWGYTIILNRNAVIKNTISYSSRYNAERAAINIASKFDIWLNIRS